MNQSLNSCFEKVFTFSINPTIYLEFVFKDIRGEKQKRKKSWGSHEKEQKKYD